MSDVEQRTCIPCGKPAEPDDMTCVACGEASWGPPLTLAPDDAPSDEPDAPKRKRAR